MNILILNGYPGKKGLSREISRRYKKRVSYENSARLTDIYDLKFDPVLHEGNYKQELEADLVKSQKDISWADKIVLVFPIWWGEMPSMMKAFMERILIPGFAFKYEKGKQIKLLKGKKVEIIATAGGSKFYYKTIGKIDQIRTVGKFLWFCGVRLNNIRVFGGINPGAKKEYIDKILDNI